MTDPLSTLPPEICHEILIAAVHARGIKRATRLRYVSRAWDAAVMDAIMASRILDDESNIGAFWARYLAYQAMGRGFLRPLRIIRMVGERLAARRSPNLDAVADDAAVRACVQEICAIPPGWFNAMHHYDLRRAYAEAQWDAPSCHQVDSNDEQFKQTLLAAAAWVNDVNLVRELLPSFEGCENLIFCDGKGRYSFRPIFGDPVALAAYRGHEEITRLLMDAIPPSQDGMRHFFLSGLVLRSAATGNQLSTLNMVLEPEYSSWHQELVNGLKFTTSVEVFKRLLPLARDNLQRPEYKRPDRDYYRDKFLPLQLSRAAGEGNIAMMEHLVDELGAAPLLPVKGPPRRDPVLKAAAKGRREAVVFLADRGFLVTAEAVQAAVRYGDPQTVKVVLGLGHLDDNDFVSELLALALEKENEAVYRLLQSYI